MAATTRMLPPNSANSFHSGARRSDSAGAPENRRSCAARVISMAKVGNVLGNNRPDFFDPGPRLLRVSWYPWDFDGSDTGQFGDAPVQPGGKGEVRGAWIVIDDNGQRRVGRDRPEKFENVLLGEGLVGHRRQQQRRCSGPLGVVRVREDLRGPQRPDADDHRRPECMLHRQMRNTASLITAQVRVGTGGTERGDGVDLCLAEPCNQSDK